MRNRSDWALLGGWLAVAAAAVLGSLLLFVCSCAGSSLLGTALSRDIGVVIAFAASILIASTAYGAGAGWAQGWIVEATRPAWRGSGFADAWCLATACGFSAIGLVLGAWQFSYLLDKVIRIPDALVTNTALVAGLAILGLAQWWVVRRLRWAGLWVPLTILAWEGGVQLSQFLFVPAIEEVSASQAVLKPEGLPLFAGYIVVASLTASILTGLGMTWLSRRPIHSR